MKFSFSSLTDHEIYETARVLFVVGPYNLFNNIAIDTMKERCRAEEVVLDAEIMEDFGITDSRAVSVSNFLNLDTFMKTVHMASMNGLWFTSADYAFMTKKQQEWLKTYMKSPSNTGRLVIYCNEFKNYRLLLKDRLINTSPSIHLIQLSFPRRDTLESIVKALFREKGVDIEQRAIELFITRMSNSYDDYNEVIDKIVLESVPNISSHTESGDKGQEGIWGYKVTYKDALNAMKGIENFVLDDFIDGLLVPLSSNKPTGRSKLFRTLGSLLDEMGAEKLVNKLRYKVDTYIEFRLAINSGIIPIKVRFSVPEAKSRLPEDSKLANISDYTFRKMAEIASRTSLRDWVYMKMMLSNIKYRYEPTSYERALYSLVNRSVLNESRLENDIGIANILKVDINYLNEIKFEESKLALNENAKQEELV